MKLGSILQWSLLLTGVVEAGEWVAYDNEYYAAIGCKSAISKKAYFCGKPESDKKYTCSCKNEYALASWLGCTEEYFPHLSKDKLVSQIVQLCQTKGKQKKMTSKKLVDNYESLQNDFVNIDEDSKYNKTSPKFPIHGKSVEKAATLAMISNKHRWDNVSTSHYMGIAFVAAVGLVMIVAGILNWLSRFSLTYNNAKTGTLVNFVRKNFSLGILGNHLHGGFLGGVNPDRVEAFFICLMFLYIVLTNFILGFDYLEGDTVFANKQAGLSRYYGDRSAISLSYHLPLLFIFPGRNNFFQVITRWKYQRFVTFHKWLARFVMMEILIHSFAMASQTYALDKFSRFQTGWYRWGIVGTVAGGIILLCAAAPIRKYYYEIFLYTHIILVVTFLYSAWLHAASQDYEDFYWACCGIWIFDRVVRIARIFLNGFAPSATVEYFPGEEVLKITVANTSKIMKPYPGAHAFIHFLTPTTFFQSHPFTVYPSESQPGHIHFTCRIKKGITKKIADLCRKSEKNTIAIKIAVDGYYGEQSPYQMFDKSVFITGGTGISGPLFHAKRLVETDANKEVKFYWSVRGLEDIKSYAPELLMFKDTIVKPVIYVSQPEGSYLSTTSSDDNENKEEFTPPAEVNMDEQVAAIASFADIKFGRLKATEIIDSEISDAAGTIAFGACSHPEVVDQVRKHIAKSLNASSYRIEYFEEMQKW